MQRDPAFLEDIIVAADAIAEFMRDHDVEFLIENRLLQSALGYQFTILGEAVSRLSETLRERHSLVPWARIKGLRNIIVHEYRGVNWAQVWDIATNLVPLLRAQIVDVFKAEFPDDTLEL